MRKYAICGEKIAYLPFRKEVNAHKSVKMRVLGAVMINNERKNQILAIISKTGVMEVEGLAQKLYTSTSTVRRNLAEMEKLGLVKRSYGKVEIVNDSLDIPIKLRIQTKHEEKQVIAAKAAPYLENKAVVFVDGSSTCLHMASFLSQHKELIVYTNGMELCTLLADSGVTVYNTGGRFVPRSLAFAGEDAIRLIRSVQFDAAFFSCAGFCDGVLSDYEEAEAQLRREILQQAKQKYFLCDTSKFGKSFHYVVGRETELTQIITENDSQQTP